MTIMQVALSPFGHSDRDFAFFDPLSTNRRLPGHADLPVLATVVFAGPKLDTIHVMVPDCLFPPVGSEVQIDLRHFLMLKPATDINEDNPQPGLAGELCTNPVTPTLLLKQKDYWEEVTPLLARWRNVNDSKCPECSRSIRVNMAHHIRLCHTHVSGGVRSAHSLYGSPPS